MKLVNTHTSKDFKKRCLVYVDNNNHYILDRMQIESFTVGASEVHAWEIVSSRKYKKIESLNRAVDKWIK